MRPVNYPGGSEAPGVDAIPCGWANLNLILAFNESRSSVVPSVKRGRQPRRAIAFEESADTLIEA